MFIQSIQRISVIVDDLNSATAAYSLLFDQKPALERDTNDGLFATFSLANMSLRLSEGAPARPSGSSGKIDHICFCVSSLRETTKQLHRVGLHHGAAFNTERSAKNANLTGDQMLEIPAHLTFGVRLGFQEQPQSSNRSIVGQAGGVTGLDHVVIKSSAPDRAAALYGSRLGLPMKLDLNRRDWGVRLIFFECNDMIVEIVNRYSDNHSAIDQLWGLSWRTSDIVSVRDRLLRNGIDISEIRRGWRPGTHVASLKSGPCRIPTLIIQPDVRSEAIHHDV